MTSLREICRHPALCRVTLLIAMTAPAALASGAGEHPALPQYQRVSGVTGNLNSIGSDTLNNLMTLWSEAFRTIYPNVVIGVEGKGSLTAPPALIQGTAQIGPMSREMRAAEIDSFESRYGYKPLRIPVAIDALALFVHKDNPLPGLTLEQVDSCFSSTFRRGGPALHTWGGLGLTGGWAMRNISLFGRNSASGTYGFFKDRALAGGDYRDNVKEQPGSSAVVQAIATNPDALGYSGIGYRTSGVRPVPLIDDRSGRPVYPTYPECLSGEYPLARFLFVYINKPPAQSVDKLTLEFLRYVLSESGQTLVVRDGYFPLPASVVEETLRRLQDR